MQWCLLLQQDLFVMFTECHSVHFMLSLTAKQRCCPPRILVVAAKSVVVHPTPLPPPPSSPNLWKEKKKSSPIPKIFIIYFLGHVNRFSGHPYWVIFFLLLFMSGCFLVCKVQIRKTRCARIKSDPFESTTACGEIKGHNCFTKIKHVWVGHCLHGN